MASEVEICNLALGHLGDTATVASLDPPEGSAQAEHCARFYPIARDMMLQAHAWNFATRRIQLAQLGEAPYGWAYSYARPFGALDVFDIQFPEVMDYAQQSYPFVCESNADGDEVIYTDVENAGFATNDPFRAGGAHALRGGTTEHGRELRRDPLHRFQHGRSSQRGQINPQQFARGWIGIQQTPFRVDRDDPRADRTQNVGRFELDRDQPRRERLLPLPCRA